MELTEIFKQLWDHYSRLNPSAESIHRLFHLKGENVINDHIAFRTFDDPRVNIDVLSAVFTRNGYRESGEYEFPVKNLYAKHYELPGDAKTPKVFISQLKTAKFSPFLKETVNTILDKADPQVLQSEDLIFSGNVFGTPSFKTYTSLREESEYAAWLYVFGFRANHFTVNVNYLQKYNNLEKVNQLLKDSGYPLNTSGGEIKGTQKQLLRQSSTLADIVEIEFDEGIHPIPACYYEFAERYKNEKGELFTGFIAGSADKIFESTDFRNKKE